MTALNAYLNSNSAMNPEPGYSALRKGRVSIPHAAYFVTLCEARRKKGLHHAAISHRIRGEIDRLNNDASIGLRAATIMPDHVHLFFRLGERLIFSQVMGRLKSKTAGALQGVGLKWQENEYEHRLRPDEPVLPVFHYIYMNPYRKGLIGGDEKWPGFWCGEEDWGWFKHHLKDDCPYPEWLGARK